MFKRARNNQSVLINRLLRGLTSLAWLFLLIEFFDELNYGLGNAALPAIRGDFGLTYVQVGMLLGLPGMINTFIEPVLMLMGDTRLRKKIVIGGGLAITLSLIVIASTHSFAVLLLGMIIAYPASGAFVSLSQATLMDLNPGREPNMMARWTASGSLGNLIGPLILAAGFALGFGWRWAFYGMAMLCLLLVGLTWFRQFPIHPGEKDFSYPAQQVKQLMRGLWETVRDPRLMRWMVLLPLSDFLLDVLTGYLPLYFTDEMGLSLTQVSLLVGVLMLAGVVSNFLLIPILERYPGRKLVRLTAGVTGLLYVLWLAIPWLWAKICLIILIRLFSMGWYEVLQGEAFAAAPGRSGTVMAINSMIGILAGGVSFLVGWIAAQAGLPAAMWLLLAGPLSLVLFTPRPQAIIPTSE